MEQEIIKAPTDTTERLVKETITNYLGRIAYYLATRYEELFPRVCFNAIEDTAELVKKLIDVDLEQCQGKRHNEDGRICNRHGWLKYGDLIIDLTDYQFKSKDYPDLKLDNQTIINKIAQNGYDPNCEPGTYSDEQMKKASRLAYFQLNHQRYLEDPNDKEKYFQDITKLLSEDNLDADIYAEEMKRCFGAKTFYYKNDPNSNVTYEAFED